MSRESAFFCRTAQVTARSNAQTRTAPVRPSAGALAATALSDVRQERVATPDAWPSRLIV